MRASDAHLLSGTDRALLAVCAGLVALTVFMGGAGTLGGAELLLAVTVAAALATSLLCTARAASPVLLGQAASSGASGHVEAPTAYWCALRAPRAPRRPRAPGRR